MIPLDATVERFEEKSFYRPPKSYLEIVLKNEKADDYRFRFYRLQLELAIPLVKGLFNALEQQKEELIALNQIGAVLGYFKGEVTPVVKSDDGVHSIRRLKGRISVGNYQIGVQISTLNLAIFTELEQIAAIEP